MVGLVVGEVSLKAGQQIKRRIGPACLGDGDGLVQADDGRRLDCGKAGTERGDLGPVLAIGRCVRGGDGGLELEGSGALPGNRAVKKRQPLVNHRRVPQAAVLARGWQGLAFGAGSGGGPGLGEEKKGEAGFDLGLVRGEVVEKEGKADGFGAEVAVGALRIAGGEDQVDHGQDRVQPVGPVLGAGDGEGDAGDGDLGPRAAEALAYRRPGNEEDGGDLRRCQPAERATVNATRVFSSSAGWQHVKIRRRRSSGIARGSGSAARSRPPIRPQHGFERGPGQQ